MPESDLFGADFKEIDVQLLWAIGSVRNLEDGISRHCGGKSAYDALYFLDRACVLMAEARDRLQSARGSLEEKE